jgi:four helix bundle protein
MNPPIRSYRDLVVWQKSLRLLVGIDRLVVQLPPGPRACFSSQVRRSALSVVSNIAEGHSRDHLGEYRHHLSFAKGSLAELEAQLFALQELGYGDRRSVNALLAGCEEVGRMLTAIGVKLRQRQQRLDGRPLVPSP